MNTDKIIQFIAREGDTKSLLLVQAFKSLKDEFDEFKANSEEEMSFANGRISNLGKEAMTEEIKAIIDDELQSAKQEFLDEAFEEIADYKVDMTESYMDMVDEQVSNAKAGLSKLAKAMVEKRVMEAMPDIEGKTKSEVEKIYSSKVKEMMKEAVTNLDMYKTNNKVHSEIVGGMSKTIETFSARMEIIMQEIDKIFDDKMEVAYSRTKGKKGLLGGSALRILSNGVEVGRASTMNFLNAQFVTDTNNDQINISLAVGGASSTVEVTIVGNTFQLGEQLRTNAGTWVYAQANNSINAESVATVSKKVGDVVTLASSGIFTVDTVLANSLISGEIYWLSPTVAGGYTTVKPSTIGQVIKPAFQYLGNNMLMVFERNGIVIQSPVSDALNSSIIASSGLSALLATNIRIVFIDSSTPITLTLSTQDITNMANKEIIIKDKTGNAGTNEITVETEGTQTIDGVNSVEINADYGYIGLTSDGSNVFVTKQ